MYFVKTPGMFRYLFPNLLWRVPENKKVLFLTFDDGPVPEVTPLVLSQLAVYDAKATFFCVGDNVRKHPGIHEQTIAAGHTVANHTYHHLNGWETETAEYMRDVEKCKSLVPSHFFRPPYGRINPCQSQALEQAGFEVVMWDVLSADFDCRLTGPQVLSNVLRHARPGSIIVFHDSLKALDRLAYALPRTLEHFAELGYRFEGLGEVGKVTPQPLAVELV